MKRRDNLYVMANLRKLFQFFKPTGGDESYDGGSNAFQLDHDMLIALDAPNNPNDTLKSPIGNLHLDTRLAEIIVPFRNGNTVVCGRGDTDEILHLLVGHRHDTLGCQVGYIPQRLILLFEHLHASNLTLSGMDEYHVPDSRSDSLTGTAFLIGNDFMTHWEEIPDIISIKIPLNGFLSTVCDTHGKP